MLATMNPNLPSLVAINPRLLWLYLEEWAAISLIVVVVPLALTFAACLVGGTLGGLAMALALAVYLVKAGLR